MLQPRPPCARVRAGNSGKDYRTKFRTLWFNLNDAANPHLRARVLRGELPPDTFVRLTPNELASRVPPPPPEILVCAILCLPTACAVEGARA